MSRLADFDIDALTAPIEESHPTGVDLRENRTTEFSQLRDARRAASTAEREAALDPDRESDAIASWKQILELAPHILTTQSKDLEVAAWFTEALMRIEGLPGLALGTQLIKTLVTQHWNELYPAPDEDGTETRVKPLLGILGGESDGTLTTALRNLPITPEGSGNDSVYTFLWWHYDFALQASRIEIPEKKAQRVEQLGYSIDDIQMAVNASPNQFYTEILSQGENMIKALSELQDALFSYAKEDKDLPVPRIGGFRDTVKDQYISCIEHLTKDKLVEEIATPSEMESHDNGEEQASESSASVSTSDTAPISHKGPIMNRQQALQQLEAVAQYFKQNEPHTPIAGALDRIIRWGSLPLPRLMQELLPGDQARQIYSQLTGIDLNAAGVEPIPAPEAIVYNDPPAAPPTQQESAPTSSGEQW